MWIYYPSKANYSQMKQVIHKQSTIFLSKTSNPKMKESKFNPRSSCRLRIFQWNGSWTWEQKLVERESCNTKCCKILINGSKIYFQTKIHTTIAGGTTWGKRGVRNSSACEISDNNVTVESYIQKSVGPLYCFLDNNNRRHI